MNFPKFLDPKMVGISACGQLKSPSKEILKFLDQLQKQRPLGTYRAQKGTAHAHIIGGESASRRHIHIDIFKSELLRADGMEKPKDNATRKSISDDLDKFLGSEVRVTYTGIFLVEQPDISEKSIIQPLYYKKEENMYIRMISSSFEFVGLGVQYLDWRLTFDDRFRVGISYIQDLFITKDYLTSPIEKLTREFDLLTGPK